MSDKFFYTNRQDGLGNRLIFLLSAMVLANHFKCQFKFTWNPRSYGKEFHAVNAVHETFSKIFINKYCIQQTTISDIIKISSFKNYKSLQNFIKSASKFIIMLDSSNIYEQFSELKKIISHDEFSKSFHSIDFHENVKHAISIANNAKIPNKVIALHMRSGDIILNEKRFYFGDRYANKAIPYSLIKKILNDKNSKFLLFSQDDELSVLLKNTYKNINLSHSYSTKNFTAQKNAFFDMILMSKCKKLYSGDSEFSKIASLIGDVDYYSVTDLFTNNEIYNIIYNDNYKENIDRHINKLHKSFSKWYLLSFMYNKLSVDDKMKLSDIAINYDDDNKFYVIAKASFLYEKGLFKEAEILLYNNLHENDNKSCGSLYDVLTNRFPMHSINLKYIQPIKKYADNKYPFASLVLFFACITNKKNEDLKKYYLNLKKILFKLPQFYQNIIHIHAQNKSLYTNNNAVNNLKNIALRKNTSQSSIYRKQKFGYVSHGACNGKITGRFGFHTDKENNPWFQIDLGMIYEIHQIKLYNRMDSSKERSASIDILLSKDNMNWKTCYSNNDKYVFGGIDGYPLTVLLSNNLARFVKLQLRDNNYFHLDEVEVYGIVPC